MTEAPLVRIVDDDDSTRKALTRLLHAHGYRTSAYRSAGEFLMSEQPVDVGCLILDVNLPGTSGLELHAALAKKEMPLPVIFLTGYGDIPMSVRAIQEGAVDFLTKPVGQTALAKAVERAIELNRERHEAAELKRALHHRYKQLTPREQQVFVLVTQGLLNKQIAGELGTCERTIKAHRARVMKKMRTRTVVALARAADQLQAQGLIGGKDCTKVQ